MLFPVFRLPEAARPAAPVRSPAAPQPPAAVYSRPGTAGWSNDKRSPLPHERNQINEAYPYGGGGHTAAKDDRNFLPFQRPSSGLPPSFNAPGSSDDERPRAPPTRKGKKRPKNGNLKSAAGGGGVGGYEINVFGPNGGRSYTIVDGLSPAGLGRRHSGEQDRGGSDIYARPPRQVLLPVHSGEDDGRKMSPWKNDKHWVGQSLHSQEAAENLPFLF
jgi:hypothetical protein